MTGWPLEIMRKTPSTGAKSLPTETWVLLGFIALLAVVTLIGLAVVFANRPAPAPALTATTPPAAVTSPAEAPAPTATLPAALATATSSPTLNTTQPTSAAGALTATPPPPTETASPAATPSRLPDPGASASPTAANVASPTASATLDPSATPGASPAPANTAAANTPAPATVTPQALNSGWQLLSYSLGPDPVQANALLIYGELLNTNPSAQDIAGITGSVNDAQGQVLATGSALVVYTPMTTVPAGGRVPLEISVAGLAAGAAVSLNVQSSAATDAWRQDLPASELTQTQEGDNYCVKGRISNPGPVLQEALIIAASLYDASGRLINFSDFTPNSPGLVVGDQTLPFTICVNPPHQGAVRYAVQTWGR